MVAGLAPELVLHSAMPIFTFVGSTVLQRDDAFSFTVVERVLQSILPPLVKSLKSRGDASKSSFALLKASRPFLCIFTDSATHVPRHRRQNFFQLLVEVLGPQDYAAAVSMLLVDRSAHKIARQARGEASSSLQLSLGVFSAQTGPVQLQALNEVWQEVLRLWESKDHDVADMTEQVFLDRLSNMNSEHSERQVNAKTQVLALLCFVKAVLASSRGLAGRQTLASSDAAYHSFVESALTMAQCQDEGVAALARDTLEGVMALIPIPLFMSIAEQLVSQIGGRHASSGFHLIATRLSSATKAERETAANSSSKIIDAARSQLAGNNAASRSAALAAIEVLSASADPQELSALGQVLPVVLTLAKDTALPSGERQKTFSILRSLAGALGPRVIAHLKPLVELSLATVVNAATPVAIVVRSFETLENLFKSVTTFMDSHLKEVLGAFSKSHLRGSLDERSITPTVKSLNRLLTTVIKRMPSEKLFACIFDLWSEASKDSTGAESLLAVLTLLNKALSQSDRAGISANYKAVFRFVLQVLDLRRLTKTLALRDVNAVEDSTVRVFVRLVLKLNETTFRPLFLRIYDWAALDLVEESDGELPVNDVGLVARRIALYKISNALSDQLRGLVSHYYSTLLDLTIELLAAFRAREVQNAELWSAVVASIAKSATHDEGTFWNPSRLSKLTPAFIGQLSMRNPELLQNLAGTPGGSGHDEVTRALAPAVAQLAKTVPDEASLKVLNSALLTQLRIDEVPTRVAALDVATAMWSETTLAAVLLGLVPETVPHIAELMESDETEVVDGTRAFIAAVERVLGEPLDSYLQ
jgi:U3 small nucleolar RNA-associated protein 10